MTPVPSNREQCTRLSPSRPTLPPLLPRTLRPNGPTLRRTGSTEPRANGHFQRLDLRGKPPIGHFGGQSVRDARHTSGDGSRTSGERAVPSCTAAVGVGNGFGLSGKGLAPTGDRALPSGERPFPDSPAAFPDSPRSFPDTFWAFPTRTARVPATLAAKVSDRGLAPRVRTPEGSGSPFSPFDPPPEEQVRRPAGMPALPGGRYANMTILP